VRKHQGETLSADRMSVKVFLVRCRGCLGTSVHLHDPRSEPLSAEIG
jgi:hypothetical protein